MTSEKDMQEIKDIFSKYQKRLKSELEFEPQSSVGQPVSSREYQQFKKEYLPKNLSWYEKGCNLSEKILKLGPDKKKAILMSESIETTHLNMTPTGAMSFAVLVPLIIIFFGSLISVMIVNSMFFVAFFILVGLAIINPLMNMPMYLANTWRMKASNQMVLCIFYTVTYMRHTSNLEHAIEFASDHLTPPLSLDLRKVLWDVETEKYENIKESLDAYLERWRDYNK